MAYDFTINLYQKDNSTLVGALAKGLFYEGEITVELNGDERFVVPVDHTHADFSQLALSMILEVVHTDQNFTKRFRINSLAEIRRGELTEVEVLALGLKFDLADLRHNLHGSLIEQSISTHLTAILSGSGFTVGTVTPSATFTLDYSYGSVLDDLYRIRELASAGGTEYDLVVNDDKTVDLIVEGNQSSTSTVEYQKNLLNLQRRVSRPEANHFTVIGGSANDGSPMTVRNARFRVTEVNDLGGSTEIVLDSDEILLSDDSANGLKLEFLDPEEATTITDSYKQGGGFDAVTVGGSPDGTFNVDDFVRFRDPAPITLIPQNLNFIQHATSVSSHGTIGTVYRDERFIDVENLLRPYETSALSGTFTAGVCEGWSVVGGDVTATENSTAAYVLNGTKSQKIVVGAFSQTPAAPTATEGAPAGVLNGSYTYKTCYVTKDGVGPLSAASSAVAPALEVVEVGLNDSGYSGRSEIIGWQIYRKKSTDADYYRVGHMDDFTATFYDNVQDAVYQETHPGTTTGPGGQGIEAAFTAVVGKSYSLVVNAFVSGPPYGQIRVELDLGDFGAADGSEKTKIATSAVTSDSRFVISIGGVQAKSASGKVRIVAHNGEAVFYLDSVVLVEGHIPPPTDYFVAESSGAELWKAAYRDAQSKVEARKEITADVHDAYPIDSTNELQLGDLITLADSDLSVNESVRIISKSFKLRDSWDAKFTFSVQTLKVGGIVASLTKAIDRSGRGAARAGSSVLLQAGSANGSTQVFEVQ